MLTFSRTLVPRFTKLLPNFSQTLDHVGAVVVFSPPMIFIGIFLFHDFTLHTFSLSYQHFLQGGRRAYNYGLAVCLYLMITARMAFTYALSFYCPTTVPPPNASCTCGSWQGANPSCEVMDGPKM